ncbi:MAG TPA: nuclease-related domain-containing protein [Ilumatobacteraceae bacterium]
MTDLIETRWKRYGFDRVYLKTPEGLDVGHVDLGARTVTVKFDEFERDLHACLERWAGEAEPPIEDVSVPLLEAEVQTTSVVRDLVSNRAGAAARAKRDEVNGEAPIRNFVARLVGVHTDERAWRVGAVGEKKVGDELAKLGPEWHVLHAVEVGTNGSDIDHVVIGPPGVLTLNTKRHSGGKAWVAEHMVMVNGQRTDYLRNSRHEAQRATKLLSAACAMRVPARGVIVFVDLDDFAVKQMPLDVHVTTRRQLLAWLHSLPTVLGPDDIAAIFAKARLSTTWLGQ